VVGAAGEIFSIRTALYVYIPKDSIIEDFFLTMKVAEKGYRVAYEPEAYAMETGSSSTREELKRKIRISAGGIQSVIRLKSILNPFKHGWLTFEYVSHRVLRWTIAPWLMIALFLMNLLIYESHLIYKLLLYGQLLFYLLAFVGYILQFREIKWKPFFVPYYFCMMNYAVIRGLFRYLSGRQSMIWERAQRA
jgi:cellulose synthase/poly-beta-1,6-N-acetylglucosamine synthase-like glycosyltransferase